MSQPNFVYIFCDELKTKALSCYGGKVSTPNIDRLAKNGILYENCFCNSPVCVASRYSILTSRYPEETGVYHNEAAYPNYPVLNGYDTFVNVLERNGYATASFGKTHIPKTTKEVFQVNNRAGGEMSLGVKKEELTNVFYPKGSFKSLLAADYPAKTKYAPEQVTENGLEWIKQQKDPYFVRFSYLQPHTPIIVPKEYTERLKIDDFDGTMKLYETVSEFEKKFRSVCDITMMSKEDLQRIRLYYQALVLWVDDQVGKILNYFEENELLDNTYFIFNADHGASRGENGCLAKQIFAPQSQRIPLIISGKHMESGKIDNKICDGLDIGPTILGLAEIDVPKEFKGINLLKEEKEYVYATIGYGEKNSMVFANKSQGKWDETHGWPRRSCIRNSRYRLDMNVRCNGINNSIEEDIFLCDYINNPEESINLAQHSEYQQVMNELKSKLLKHVENSKEVENILVLENSRKK